MDRQNKIRLQTPVSYNYGEVRGNFYFLKNINATLYKKIISAEKSAKINIQSSAIQLRSALEYFVNQIADEHTDYADEIARKTEREIAHHRLRSGQELSLHNRIELLKKSKFSYLNFDHNAAIIIKDTGNNEAHTGRNFVGYLDLCDAFGEMLILVRKYYNLRPKKYEPIKQPINDIFIYDWSECIDKEYNTELYGFRVHGRNREFFIIREYSNAKNVRDIDGLYILRNTSFEISPYIPSFDTIRRRSSDNNDKTTYLICLLKGRPYKLFEKYTKDKILFYDMLDDFDKKNIMIQLATALSDMHQKDVYHRNLKIDSILFVFRENNLYAMLKGFEYAKVIKSDYTVVEKVPTHEQNPYQAPEINSENTKKNSIKNKTWQTADIYSLGVVYAVILSGVEIKTSADLEKAKKEIPIEYQFLVKKMTDKAAARRLKLNQVLDFLSN